MLGKNLKSMREMYGKSQKEVCEAINIEQSTLANYENGKRVPKIDILIKLAKYYNVSVDFLLEIEGSGGNNYANYQLCDYDIDFRGKIQSLMKEQDISEQEFMQLTGFSVDEMESYLYGSKIPSLEDLIKIAGALKVSTDYMLDMSPRKRLSTEDELLIQTITDRERDLIEVFRQLSVDDQDIIIGESKKFLREQRYYESVAADSQLKQAK